MGSRFSCYRVLNRWSPFHFETYKKIITCMRTSIDIVRWLRRYDSPLLLTIHQQTIALWSISQHMQKQHQAIQSKIVRRTWPFIFQYCTPAIFRLPGKEKNMLCGLSCTRFRFFCVRYFDFMNYYLLKAKPLFGLINLLDAFIETYVLRCCILVPSLHGSTSTSSTARSKYGMIIGFGLCTVGTKVKTISTNSHRVHRV